MKSFASNRSTHWKTRYLLSFGITLAALCGVSVQAWAADSVSPDQAFFQNVANHWLNDTNSTSPAVLKNELSQNPSRYVLGPGDTLLIAIQDLPFYAHEPLQAEVLETGEVTIPPFGTYTVAGLTVPQVTQMLEEMARFYIKSPHAYVLLKSARASHASP